MTTPAPASQQTAALASALTRYRVMAWATGVLLVLLTLHVVLQVVQLDGPFSWGAVFEQEGLDVVVPGLGHLIPIAHGWLYLLYVVTAVDLWLRTRLPVLPTFLVVLAGTVPFMSFVAERWVTGRVAPMVRSAAAGG